MTREEAIEDIEKNILPVVGGKSLRMAIKALEAEPCEDAVSRVEVIRAVECMTLTVDDTVGIIKSLPPVTPKLLNIDFLMPESELVFYDNDHGFCINTQDVLEHIERYVQWER